MSTQCIYSKPWIGRCKNLTHHELTEYCTEHMSLKCVSCGMPATHGCTEASSLVCGAPICKDCTHVGPDQARKTGKNHGPKELK